MKKISMTLLLCICASPFLSGELEAKNATTPQKDVDVEYIVTTCGTVHKIEVGTSSDDAIEKIEYFSDLECNEDLPK